MNKKIIYNFFFELSKNFVLYDIPAISAQVGFFCLFSIFPFMLFIVSVLPFFDIPLDVIEPYIKDSIPIGLQKYVLIFLEQLLTTSSKTILSFSVIALTYSTSSAISSMIHIIDKMYNLKYTQNFIITRVKALLITTLLFVLITITCYTFTLDSELLLHLLNITPKPDLLLDIIQSLVLPILFFIILLSIYYAGANLKLQLKHFVPGAIFSILTSYLSIKVLNFYTSNFVDYELKYGSLGFIILFLWWIYFTSNIILIGSLINSTLFNFKKKNQLNKK